MEILILQIGLLFFFFNLVFLVASILKRNDIADVVWGLGFVLLFSAQLMYSGSFTVGDFALFTAYLWPMTEFMRLVGYLITLYRQSGVSFVRMEKIMQGSEVGRPVAHNPIYLTGEYPELQLQF